MIQRGQGQGRIVKSFRRQNVKPRLPVVNSGPGSSYGSCSKVNFDRGELVETKRFSRIKKHRGETIPGGF